MSQYKINQTIESRLRGAHESIMAGYRAGVELSSASKGTERELFVSTFLSQHLPPHYRFASGDIVDRKGNQSGQVDVIVESPYLYSFPFHVDGPRLYPAEAAGVVLEVKSDLSKQWSQVTKTVNAIRKLRKTSKKTNLRIKGEKLQKILSWTKSQKQHEIDYANNLLKESDSLPSQREDIPIYVIGFKGWGKKETISERRQELELDGLIVLENLKAEFAEPMHISSNTRNSVMVTRYHDDIKTLWYLLDMIDRHVKATVDQIELMDAYFENATINATDE